MAAVLSPLAAVRLALVVVATALVAWRQHRALQASRARNVRLQELNEAVCAISMLSADDPLFQALCYRAVASSQALLACVYVQDGEVLRRVASAGPVNTVLKNVPVELDLRNPDVQSSYTAGVLRTGIGMVSNDYALDSRAGYWRKEAVANGLRAIAWTPIRRQSGPAVLMLCATERDFFDPDRLHIAELLCETASNTP